MLNVYLVVCVRKCKFSMLSCVEKCKDMKRKIYAKFVEWKNQERHKPFISKHGIDLTDMHLHLCGHPLAFLGNNSCIFCSVAK